MRLYRNRQFVLRLSIACLLTVVIRGISASDDNEDDDGDIRKDPSNQSSVVYTSDLLDDDDSNLFVNDGPERQSDYNSRYSSNHGIKSSKNTFSHDNSEACFSTFKAPDNSIAMCSKTSKNCRVTCTEGYTFPRGISTMTFVCEGTKYKVKGSLSYAIPICLPVCNPPCENGGTCDKPNKCNCPKNYDGPSCQLFILPSYCQGFPNTPLNSRKKCNSGACTISCIEGYRFPDSSTVSNVFCKNGKWIPAKSEWSFVPDCRPVCEPPCLNGGNCIGHQKCQCPTDFRGPLCQYPESSCDVSKLNFNGNYNCSDNMEKNTCTLSCPQGSTLEPFKTPIVEYTCLYKTGEYEPKQIPQCMFGDRPSSLVNIFNTVVEVINLYKKRPEICVRWGSGNYKTFDGKIYSFQSDCTYTLISDVKNNAFHVQAHFNHGKISHINIYIVDNLYQIRRNIGDNIVTLMNNEKSLAIPNELTDIGVQINSGQTVFINLRSVNLKIVWKSNGMLKLDAGVELWNATDGLCGKMDGNPENDFSHKSVSIFANKWLVNGLNDICDSPITEVLNVSDEIVNIALQFCSVIKTNRFNGCINKELNAESYIEACKMDYIKCITENGTNCGCDSIAAFAEECFGKDRLTPWRDENLCPYRCLTGKVYSQCLPEVQETCMITGEVNTKRDNIYCEEGCVCPVGTVLNDGVCISKDKCPCKLRNILYQPGNEIAKDCNKCTCIGGEWSCTTAKCQAECYAIGDPHYKTFDGMKYNFMGACSYYLVVLPEFSIEAENVPCDGTMSLEHDYGTSTFAGKATCTKTVIIRIGNNTTIILGQGKLVFINGEIVEKLPINVKGLAYIREQSTFFLQIVITNGIEVWWDGETRVYIYASPELEGKPKGLCGTYNGNQKDDMFTPEGDIETNVVSFANKWKTKESCANNKLENVIKTVHPCDENVQYKHLAEKYCSNVTGKLFSECHAQVDPIPYYDDCLYDVCSCNAGQFSRCYCQILASYALECSHQNIIVDWRRGVRECGVQCPAGQHYETCGNSCQRTCYDISTINACKSTCVEGCFCPKGLTLSDSGECIPVAECPCYNNGHKYKSGQQRIEKNDKHGSQVCTCKSATWECRLAKDIELTLWKDISEISCNHKKHLTFTECEPSEPITCRNMHDPPHSTPAICYSGCICKKPYVLDSFTKECVLPTECPCHHGGKSYNNTDTFYQGCNTCECNLGKWQCTNNECPGICSVWGDSHFQTFDSRYFDFQGACEYILSKGSLTSYESFVASVEIVPCGTTGATCIKSVKLTVGSGDDIESIQLKNKHYSSNTKRLLAKEFGNFVIVEVTDLGIQIYWDRGTRINLQVDQKWKNNIKGLCGNYNDNQMDDFQTPYGGIPEVSSALFGDSWKLQSYCSQPTEIRDACVLHPHRRQWAVNQCSLLKSSVFKPCHFQVSIDNYIERCIFDTCACDQGGDCECLCTAIAAYAQECSIHGIYIKWRSQDICPIQCENGSTYDSCVPRCFQKSCDDYISQTPNKCDDTFCIEGCAKNHCPYGQVYMNSTSNICVPINKCKIPCIIEGINRQFNDGDIVSEDSCHSCFCSRNKKVCKGQPCYTTTTTTTIISTISTSTTSNPISDQNINKTIEKLCLNGWSAWIHINQLNSSKVLSKYEYMPTFYDLKSKEYNNLKEVKNKAFGMCEREKMSNIQCRPIKSKKSVKDLKDKFDCNIEKGLVCNGKCNDYEIRVYCKCTDDTNEDEEEENNGEIINEDRIVNKTQIVCPDGFRWHDCKVMCNQVCNSFENQLKTTSMCVYPQKCIGGCINENEQFSPCPDGSLWRDNNTCVSKSDCTCFSRNGTQVKPGGIFKEDWCTVCQCINNAYICDDSSCHYQVTTEKIELTTQQFQHTTEYEEFTTPFREIINNYTLEKKGHKHTTDEQLSTTQFTTEHLSTVKWPESSTLRPIIVSTTFKPEELYTNLHTETTTDEIVFIPSTVSLPIVLCNVNNIKPITMGIEPLSFYASSSYDDNTAPEYAQLYSEEKNYWRPIVSSVNEYLQIYLGSPEAVYGVEMSGSPFNDEYVTSYQIAYSMDGVSFSYVLYHGQVQIFRGPHTHDKVETQMFFAPIEAKYVRIKPRSWRNNIAIRVALLGCPVTSTTTGYELHSTNQPTIKSICSDPMGIENGLLNNMISVSSSTFENFNALNVSLRSNTAWIPFTASTNQWIQVDFTEPRIITGVVTKGIPSTSKTGEAWTEAYKIVYSNDLINWNKILDSNLNEQIYSANFDGQSSHTVFLDTPIKTRYIRIHPEKWYNMPALRLEILGCFEEYVTESNTMVVPTTIKPVKYQENCNVCPGVANNDCKCSSDTWWNGESCGLRSECPCVLGIMTYQVGTVYDLENCQQCTCTLGGLPDCAPKHCAPCPPGEMSITKVSSCDCLCKPCENGTKLCPTSNVCLDKYLWCNGIQDCPDDEINCPAITTTTTTTMSTTTSSAEEFNTVIPPIKRGHGPCPEIKCPEGQIARILNSAQTKPGPIKFARKTRSLEMIEDDPWPSPFSPMTNLAASLKRTHHDPLFSTKTTVIRRKIIHIKHTGVKNDNQQPICKQWICEAPVEQVKCKTPSITCPEGYFVQITPNENDICPVSTCVSNVLEESECEIDGRVFKTFDGTTFKYEVCDHILVRDRIHKKWMIKQIRRCPYIGACQVSLWIDHLNHTIEFFPNMTATYDGYLYTVNQLLIIGSQSTQFAVKQVQTNYIIFASTLGFSIIWQVNGQVKIKVNAFYTGKVDGLCGFFDNNPNNDKLKRDGYVSTTTSDFGNSWADSNIQCEAKICPMHIQKTALEACGVFRSEPLNQCGHHENVDEFVMKCVENICSCSENSENDLSECRCKAISGLVTQCYISNSSVELSDWRILHDCPVSCPAQLVYKECFNKVCEPSCDSLLQSDPCPKLPGICFPGCYCPDGYIKELDTCIKPSKCRNCVCEGSGTDHYTTFDKVDFTHKQNCSHILVKTTKENDSLKPGFSIIETTGKCSNKLLTTGVCVQNLTIIHAAHELRLYYNEDGSKIQVTVDGNEVNNMPFSNKWLLINESPGKSVTASIPILELEVVFMTLNKGFSIKMPSHLYFDKTEGLCGSCNDDSTDDMAAPDGNIPINANEFVKSWKANGTNFEQCETAIVTKEKEETCTIPKPDVDPCLKLMDSTIFGQCHAIVDVNLYLKKCHSILCQGHDGSFCHSLEAYVRECQSFGVCLDWRSPNLCPYSCPKGLFYKACSSGCEETCDNFKSLRSGETPCKNLPTEMCICPVGQVFNNSECVNENRCEPCDNDNHFIGDKWFMDKCTTCTCTAGSKTVRCERKQCPQSSYAICQTGFKSVKDENNSDECCDEFKCVPEENIVQNCTDVAMPVCAVDQVVKMELTVNGCKRFICECKPRDQCVSVLPDSDVELLPGMINVINNQGCCPSFQAICAPETCPTPKPCPIYYEQININNHACCPQFKCHLPDDTCVYEYDWIASNEGGERRRTENEKTVDLKRVNDTWEDGPCRSCYCDATSTRGTCSKIVCPAPVISTDYVIATHSKYGQCCPTYKKEACIFNNTVYTVGSEWSSFDPCVEMSCKLDNADEAFMTQSVKSCNTECPLGWVYTPSVNSCCGTCLQKYCVMQNKTYADNDTWTYDNCTSFICSKSEFNEFNIIPAYHTCPNIGDCPENRIYYDGCCEQCNNTGAIEKEDHSLCTPESLPRNQTVGLVIEDSPFHDLCTNTEAIVGFKECKGLCDSYTYFNKKTSKHDSKCQCCQPIRFDKLSVSLECKDGYRYEKSISVPSACSCTACGGESFSIKKSRKH